MDSDTTFSTFRHAREVRARLNSTPGLPFKQILCSLVFTRALARHTLEYRTRFYPPDRTLQTFLCQVLSDDKSCQAAVAKMIASLAAQGEPVPSSNTAAYCNARGRLPEELLSDLACESGRELHEQTPNEWRWRGRCVKLVDGSTLSMPDTKENQQTYPQPKSQKLGIGFPIARVVAIISCAVGAVLALALGPYSGKGSGEHGLLRELMHTFVPEDVVLGDRYYGSFFLIAELMHQGVDVLFPLHRARGHDFRRGQRLGKKDHLVNWNKPLRPAWMDQSTYEAFPDHITVREVAVQLDSRGFRTKSRILVTSFLEPSQTRRHELAALYDHRWLVELDLRSIKQTMKMDILRAKTPEMVRKEIWVHLLGYNLIRKVMAQAAQAHQKNPRHMSFKLALQVIIAFRQAGVLREGQRVMYDQLLEAIAYKTVGNRPGRHEPRRVKRRPKPYPRLMKPRHQYRKKAA